MSIQKAYESNFCLEEHSNHKTAQKYLNGGFGSVLGFGPKSGFDAAQKFINN